jgi:hypothetical protein
MALIAALGLMMLAGGLLAGTALASVELRRATRTLGAAARADSELRRGMASVLQGWDARLDSMPIGAGIDRAAAPVTVDGIAVRVRTRVQRLSLQLYAARVTVQVGDSAAPTAARRGRLLLRRATVAADTVASSASPSVRPLGRWSVADLP